MRDAAAFAQGWAAAWNAHDLDAVMAHHAEDVVFRSRKAVPIAGTALIRGKAALRAYWAEALRRQPDLRFTVETVFEGPDLLVIAYRNHRGVRAAETLRFGPDGRVVEGSACHAPRSAQENDAPPSAPKKDAPPPAA